jgi:secretion/DNA translocation related TadE-like protein
MTAARWGFATIRRRLSGAWRRRGCAQVPAVVRGSATVWVVMACLVTWSVATVALSVGGALVARHRAASAADLAALAGARVMTDHVGDPCVEARRVAAAAQARLIACDRLADGSLQVVAEVALPPLLARWPDMPPARARARAGRSAASGSAASRSAASGSTSGSVDRRSVSDWWVVREVGQSPACPAVAVVLSWRTSSFWLSRSFSAASLVRSASS